MLICVFSECLFCCFFCFKQKTAYEMRISGWSSDVCSSDLVVIVGGAVIGSAIAYFLAGPVGFGGSILVAERDPAYGEAATPRSAGGIRQQRSEERRVGKEWVSTCRSRWSPYH